MKCDNCNTEVVVGDWPFCPHGPSRYRVDAFDPYFDTDLTEDGVWISSAHQRRKIMDERGVEYKEQFRNYRKGKSVPLFFDMKRG